MTGPLFESQRLLRQKRAVAMRRGQVAVLDIGSSKLACLILQFDAEKAQAMRNREGVGSLAGQGDLRVIGAATTKTRGVELGEIVDMEEAERGVRTVVQAAQKMANVRADHVIVTFSGGRPRSYGVHGEVDLEDGVVTEYEIGRVLAKATSPITASARGSPSTRFRSTSSSTVRTASMIRGARSAPGLALTCTF